MHAPAWRSMVAICALVATFAATPFASADEASAVSASSASNPSGAEQSKTGPQGNEVDAKIPSYERTSGQVAGTIKSVGSDTMNNLMTVWAEGFRKLYPNVLIEIEGKGSSTAPRALNDGTANFGPMSRAMKSSEIDHFEAKHGYKPTELRTAIDMLAVYVHKDNPIAGLTLEQLDAIFSRSRKGGYPKDIVKWGDLGLKGEWESQPISLYGRNAASGTYGYFKEYALFGGDYKASVKEQPGSSSVVQGIANDKFAIGYSGIGYKTSDVRAVPLAFEGEEFVPAMPDNAYSGDYPLSRFLYVYVNYRPGSQLDPLRREFIKYVMSMEGQRDVIKDGYLPITGYIAKKSLESIGVSSTSDSAAIHGQGAALAQGYAAIAMPAQHVAVSILPSPRHE